MDFASSVRYSKVEHRLNTLAEELKRKPDPVASELREILSLLTKAVKQDIERLEHPPRKRLAGAAV